MRVEVYRQLFHLCNGIFILLLYGVFGKALGWVLFLLSLLGLFLSFYHTRVSRLEWAEPLLKHLEREENRDFPGKGAILYGLGVSLAILLYNPMAVKASIACLAFGDVASTLVGKAFGRHRIFWNRRLSVEGSVAFVVASFLGMLFMLPPAYALVASVVGAFVETIPKVDDNFSIPVLVGAVMDVLKGY